MALTHVQGLAELHEARTGPHFKPVKVLLDAIPSFQKVNSTTQLCVTSKLAEGALNPTVHVADKDVKTSLVPVLTPEESHSSLISTWTSSR